MPPRYVLLVDGQFRIHRAKMAVGVLRYRPEQVVAVLDRQNAGRSVGEVIGLAHPAPIVGSVAEAAARGANRLMVGTTPTGGALPEEWTPILLEALEAGLDLVAGMHTFLADEPALAAAANRLGRRLIDLRRPPAEREVANLRVLEHRAKRVLTVGTDCAVGKMTASLELTAAARAEGYDCRFLATGQTGIAIADDGIPLDAIVGDFMAGAVEALICRQGDADVVMVEGQGSLLHPGYSGVTLALLHGAVPDAMILCADCADTQIKGAPVPLPPLDEVVALYEACLAPIRPCPVVGLTLMTRELDEIAARRALDAASDRTGLPATDVIRFGCAPLAACWRP